ncbi:MULTISPECIES: tetratricopeptide repeat protein [Haemophilus]|uniref:tetratricopeptide repeat protein n=1 Tax=Haemophilus TaxID=724 RepID=UPI00021B32C4|nr:MULTISPECIES: SEL1-like repeat protein [Haemophilus]EGT81771.1 putative sel1-like protein [Haemophilus haemolyticus M21639]
MAEQGDVAAQNNLGVMYSNGQGVKRNLSEAKEWFRKACDNGGQGACDALRKLEK